VHPQHPVRHDRDVVAQALDHLEHVAGEDDGAAAGHVTLEDVADQRCRDRVDRLERFVQHQQPRCMQQRAGQADLLLHAGRIVDHQGAVAGAQLEHVEQLPGSLVDGRRVHPTQQPVIGEQLGAGQPVEVAYAVGQHAEPGLGRGGVGPHVVPEQDGLTRGGPQQADRHRQCRGLAGPVRAEQAVEGTGRHLQAHAGDRELGVEMLDQAAERHGRDLLTRTLCRHRHGSRT
jgi:hypothetical protein